MALRVYNYDIDYRTQNQVNKGFLQLRHFLIVQQTSSLNSTESYLIYLKITLWLVEPDFQTTTRPPRTTAADRITAEFIPSNMRAQFHF